MTDNLQPIHCTIMFVDMVDSSLHSRILKIEVYARILEDFHQTMEKTYEEFKQQNSGKYSQDNSIFHKIEIRGDEAVGFFSTDTSKLSNGEDIIMAIKLALQMKFAWKRVLIDNPDIKEHIELAIGVNRGEVILISNESDEIKGIEGHEINLAKRVESSSRVGKYTNIFISEKAKNSVKNSSVIFEKYEGCDLRGIGERENLYEVKEFIFDDITPLFDDPMMKLIEKIIVEILPSCNKPWLEMYLVTLLFGKLKETGVQSYKDKISEIIKNSCYPEQIFLKFLKAYLLVEDELVILKLKYYQEIVHERPTFLPARKEIIRLYEKVYEKIDRLDPLSLQVKNYIDEMKKFNNELIEPNERDLYERLLDKINAFMVVK